MKGCFSLFLFLERETSTGVKCQASEQKTCLSVNLPKPRKLFFQSVVMVKKIFNDPFKSGFGLDLPLKRYPWLQKAIHGYRKISIMFISFKLSIPKQFY